MNKCASLRIYNPEFEPLGEAVFNDDQFSQAVLNETGESRLDDWFFDWQIHGIEHRRLAETNKSGEQVLLHDSVRMQSPAFAHALRKWLESSGFYAAIIPEYALDLLDLLEEMPLSAEEKFLLSTKLVNLSRNEAALWQQELSDYLYSASTQEKSSGNILELKLSQIKPRTASKTRPVRNGRKSVKSDKSVKSIKPIKSVKSVKPIKSVKSVKSIKSVMGGKSDKTKVNRRSMAGR